MLFRRSSPGGSGSGGGRFTTRNIILGCVMVFLVIYGLFILNVFWQYRNRTGAGGAATNPRAEAEDAAKRGVPPDFSQQKAIQAQIDALPPQTVAWAIPVGGRTRRSEQLRAILTNLLTHGVNPSDVFVFEDVLSRENGVGDKDVSTVAKNLGVRVVFDYVKRDSPPGGGSQPFGLFLARHYRFMFEYLFVPGARSQHTINFPDKHSSDAIDPNPTQLFQFVVVLEDDLTLAPDTVKYFHSMSRVMAVDPTLYCACAHQDNAFYATSNDDAHLSRLQLTGFEFRRGNHFMAPGWMTSARVYTEVVRPTWLDAGGNLIYGKKYIPNGHWDRFWDARIEERECIFPSNPRIVHIGADGFTVSKAGQLELYANIRLSRVSAPPTVALNQASTALVTSGSGGAEIDYGEMWRMTASGYEFAIESFIRDSTLITVLEEIALFRSSQLLVRIEANSDRDMQWNHVLAQHFGLIGLGGYGGHAHYAKLRGVHRGSVVVTWLTNTVLIVATYSPYTQFIKQIQKQPFVLPGRIQYRYEGCYVDKWDRDLSILIPWYNDRNVSPARCTLSCHILGYPTAGIQAGQECWCGGTGFGKYGSAASSGDDRKGCDVCPVLATGDETLFGGVVNAVSRLFTPSDMSAGGGGGGKATPAASAVAAPQTCGGAFRNSIYSISRITDTSAATNDAAVGTAAATNNALRTRLGGVVGGSGAGPVLPLKPILHPTAGITTTPYEARAMPSDLAYIKGGAGLSCDAACAATKYSDARYSAGGSGGSDGGGGGGGGGSMVCRDQFLPYIHNNCPLLRKILGCESCLAVPNAELAYMAPYRTGEQRECYLSKASFLRCDVSPAQPTMHRACVCQVVGGGGTGRGSPIVGAAASTPPPVGAGAGGANAPKLKSRMRLA